ncbi:hypothetical protein CXF83_16290 [Shewanella sp. Choline-02u-19]|uniref:hypothetical protein n=1 Tax=unclassified Shewanella TaxID=196818 RepID=UPI000C34A9E1|nr:MULTISPECIES: hypothetical protein [unclassified Shewanella]PKG57426.1 hypothetical protein CXF82_09685 [Shewanella sp. GutDb-MelDb]PKH54190.1 hypothetical protein CXF84_20445 [Shewanella sp. Bg11-22]PKI28161.1 hypothetical protein CXF83_16290 [Shewanella sp. Choline-02u-19]
MKRIKPKSMFVITLLILVASPLSAAENPFIGSWKLTSGQYLDGNGKWVQYGDLKLSAIKVISENHFSFTTMKNIGTEAKPESEFWAAGTGRYTYTATEYVEYPQLNSFGVAADMPFAFTYQITGEEWQTKRTENGELKEQELWLKLD